MAWLGSISYASGTVISNTLIENLNKDIRTWGGNVDGGGYTLANLGVLDVVNIDAEGALFKPASGTLTLQFQDGVPTATGRLVQSNLIMQLVNNALPIELVANTNGGITHQLYLADTGNIGIRTDAQFGSG